MAMFKIYVGNLSFNTTEEHIKALFEPHGELDEVIISREKESQKPMGYGFVLMPNEDEGRRAIDAVNMSELDGRRLVVKASHGKKKKRNSAQQQTEERPRRRGFRRARARGYGQGTGGESYVPRARRMRDSLMGGEGGGGGGDSRGGGQRGGGGYRDNRGGGDSRGGGYSRGYGQPQEPRKPKPDYDDDSFGNR